MKVLKSTNTNLLVWHSIGTRQHISTRAFIQLFLSCNFLDSLITRRCYQLITLAHRITVCVVHPYPHLTVALTGEGERSLINIEIKRQSLSYSSTSRRGRTSQRHSSQFATPKMKNPPSEMNHYGSNEVCGMSCFILVKLINEILMKVFNWVNT